MGLKAAIVSNDGKRIGLAINTPEAIPFETSTFRGKMLLLHRPLDFPGEAGDGSGEEDAAQARAAAGAEEEDENAPPWVARWRGQKRRVEFRVQGKFLAELGDKGPGSSADGIGDETGTTAKTSNLDGADGAASADDKEGGGTADANDEQAAHPTFAVEIPGPLEFSYASRCVLSGGINLLASGHGTPITVNTEYEPGTETGTEASRATDGGSDAVDHDGVAEGGTGPVWPTITVPLTSIHVLKATGPGTEPPDLMAAYMRKTPPAEKAEVMLNTTDTFTFALWSSRLDLLRWETCNMPWGLDCYLSSIIGDRPLRLNIEGVGSKGARLRLWSLELSYSEGGEEHEDKTKEEGELGDGRLANA